MWCRSGPNSVQNRLKRCSFSSVRLPDLVGCQFVQFSSGDGGQVSPFSSFRTALSVQLTNSFGPDVDFVPFPGALGGMVAFGPLGFAFEGYGSPPPVNSYMCIPTEFKDDICTDYFQKCMQIVSCKGKLYHRIKQNAPESEYRQSDRLRLRLLAH